MMIDFAAIIMGGILQITGAQENNPVKAIAGLVLVFVASMLISAEMSGVFDIV